MGFGNRAVRSIALPFISLPWGFTRTYTQSSDIAGAGQQYTDVASWQNIQKVIRMNRPKFGDMTEAYLNMKLRASNAEASPLTFKVAIGTFVKDGLGNPTLVATASYSSAYVDASHLLLTGTANPFSVSPGQTIEIKDLPIVGQIPKRGNAEFQEDGWVLVISWNRAPINDQQTNVVTPFAVYFVRADCAATVVP
jgi:hypothetical protein